MFAVLLVLVAMVLVGRDAYRHAETRPGATRSDAAAGSNESPRVPEPVIERRGAAAIQPPTLPASEQPARKPIVRVRPGERVALHNSPGGKVVAEVDDETSFGSATAFAVNSRRPGWLGVPSEELPNGELGWVKADPEELRGESTPYRILVDLSAHEARLYDGDKIDRKWAVTVGTPATPTPTGRFSVTDLIEGGLNPVYGCCAIAISATQPYLPAGWTGGDRIAFHGGDDQLGLDASNGCIRSPDGELRALIRKVPLGTPVRIRS